MYHPALPQAMVFAVTMNSKRNALLALMIATNFVELKGQVYKRTDTNKLWGLACQVGVQGGFSMQCGKQGREHLWGAGLSLEAHTCVLSSVLWCGSAAVASG
jgi:hypothetical protein